MKTLLRSVVPVLSLFMLVSSSLAAAAEESPAESKPRGWLGVLLADSDAVAQSVDATEPPPAREGVLIRGVVDGSPADQVGLRAKDSILAVDGAAVSGASELYSRLRDLAPGTFVALSVKRSGRDLEKSTVLGTRPDRGNRWKMVRGWLGIEAIELPSGLRTHFGAPEDAGVLVSSVVEGSPADDSGIRIGDVIYEADGEPVTSVEALSEFVSGAGVENTMDVVLARDGARIVVAPVIERAP